MTPTPDPPDGWFGDLDPETVAMYAANLPYLPAIDGPVGRYLTRRIRCALRMLRRLT